jgi:tetratricopeptide (TPR) repeat protein
VREGRGRSLRPLLDGRYEARRRDLYVESLAGSLNYGWAELRGLRHGPWKLIDAPEPELYRLDQDPGETENLAPREPERLSEMRSALTGLTAPLEGAAASEPALDAVLDPATERLLASLGYVAGGAGGSAASAPSPRDVIDVEAELLAGQSALAEGAWAQVEDVCRYVLQRDPTNKWSLVSLATTLVHTERAAEAEAIAADLLLHYPDSDQAYFQLAQALKTQGRESAAQDVLDRGAEALPESEMLAYYRLVNAFDLGRAGLCEDAVPAAVTKFERSGTMRVLRARCQARAGQAEAAVATLGEAVDRGFAQIERLTEADEFRELATRVDFRALVERKAPAGG